MNITDNSFFRRTPPVVLHLLIINILLFIATEVFFALHIDLTDILGLKFWRGSEFHYWQFLTHMFMHGGLTHLFFNMFALWTFGIWLERLMGSKRFLFYYLICGLGAALLQELSLEFTWMDVVGQSLAVDGQHITLIADQVAKAIASKQISPELLDSVFNSMISVGASGAVFGVLVAFAWFFPNANLYLFFIPVPIKAKWMVLAYGLLELFFGVSGLNDGIAHFAHIGGLLIGLIILLFWKFTNTLDNKNVHL